MQWAWHRDQWIAAAHAVENTRRVEGLEALSLHATVKAALAQIDMAERAIASVADGMLIAYYDEPEEV